MHNPTEEQASGKNAGSRAVLGAPPHSCEFLIFRHSAPFAYEYGFRPTARLHENGLAHWR